jgi:hypothetical protein
MRETTWLASAWILVLQSALVGALDCFQADFDSVTGVKGYFRMEIGESQAQYTYDFEFNNFAPCDHKLGLLYHIHVNWTAAEDASTSCGQTGRHYDPTLACAPASASVNECSQLGRTSAQGYQYSCLTTQFSQGNYFLCEVGDLSNKLGVMYPVINGNTAAYKGSLIDPYPVTPINYDNQTGIAKPWKSFVFHCPSTTNRILCGLLKPVVCSASSESSSTGTLNLSIGAFSGIIMATVVGSVIFGSLIGFFCMKKYFAQNSVKEMELSSTRNFLR